MYDTGRRPLSGSLGVRRRRRGSAALASHYLLEGLLCLGWRAIREGGVESRGKAVCQQGFVPIPVGPMLAGHYVYLLVQMDVWFYTKLDVAGQDDIWVCALWRRSATSDSSLRRSCWMP